MNQNRYYITTSIPYVNARPHIGFALEAVQTDALARYHRLVGDDTRFQTGTDDNALKNVQAAEAEGITTQELVDRNAVYFKALRAPLALSWDDFIRTSGEERHRLGAQKLWSACDSRGDIYTRTYRGLYCVGCERFYAEDELVDGRCPIHRTVPEPVEEENYFFRLSRYADALVDLIESGSMKIEPETRRNEVLSFVRGGLEDLSISRTQARARGWGVPVPDDPGQVMYVWFDALSNYVTALGYGYDDERHEPYKRYWLENSQRVHVIGKDILRFHAVYWPAMLLSAGEPAPSAVYVHEFLTVEGQKISKSLGNVIDPVALTNEYGTDALRYWLLRDMPRTEDGNFTLERLITLYNGDLANDLGNLLNRTVSMIGRYRDGRVPEPGPELPTDRELRELARRLPEETRAALDAFDFRTALSAVWALVTRANRYVEEAAPWVLAKEAKGGSEEAARKLDTALYNLAESLRLLSLHLSPYLPTASEKVAGQLGLTVRDDRPYAEATRWGGLALGTRVSKPEPIFPKVEVPEVQGV